MECTPARTHRETQTYGSMIAVWLYDVEDVCKGVPEQDMRMEENCNSVWAEYGLSV